MIAWSNASLLAEVRGDGDGVAGAGVRPGQRLAADAGVEGRARPGAIVSTVGGALHVAQLAPVAGSGSSCTPLVQPRKMSLAACIIRWPCTTRSPGWWYRLFGRWSSSTERGRLLDLQEQRVLLRRGPAAAR